MLTSSKLPNLEDLRGSLVHPRQFALPDSGNIEEIGDMTPEGLVFRSGRTSGLVCEMVHTLDSGVQICPGVDTRVFSVTRIGASESSSRGDSGSWVVDQNGRWVGLFFAEPGISLNKHSFVLPAREVIEDIESVTGGRVSLP